jgi:hypothetical protein
MSCIKHLGRYPCPRCFIQKDQIRCIGSALDMRRRATIRRDGHPLHDRIRRARENVFEKRIALNSSILEGILAEGSIVITRVCSTSP